MKMDQESDLFNLTDYTNGKIFYEIWEDKENYNKSVTDDDLTNKTLERESILTGETWA